MLKDVVVAYRKALHTGSGAHPVGTRGSFPAGKSDYTTPQYVFMVWYLGKHRNNFIFTFTRKNEISPPRNEGGRFPGRDSK
jgi:hypothetical protein